MHQVRQASKGLPPSWDGEIWTFLRFPSSDMSEVGSPKKWSAPFPIPSFFLFLSPLTIFVVSAAADWPGRGRLMFRVPGRSTAAAPPPWSLFFFFFFKDWSWVKRIDCSVRRGRIPARHQRPRFCGLREEGPRLSRCGTQTLRQADNRFSEDTAAPPLISCTSIQCRARPAAGGVASNQNQK